MPTVATKRERLSPFQELVVVVASFLGRRRVSSYDLTMKHIYEVTLTNPRAMTLMDVIGWRESSWKLADQKTLLDAVLVNMRFRERPFYYDKVTKTVLIEPKEKVVEEPKPKVVAQPVEPEEPENDEPEPQGQ
jgi:hypothetical protein